MHSPCSSSHSQDSSSTCVHPTYASNPQQTLRKAADGVYQRYRLIPIDCIATKFVQDNDVDDLVYMQYDWESVCKVAALSILLVDGVDDAVPSVANGMASGVSDIGFPCGRMGMECVSKYESE